jgi:hypothetical protein
LAPGFRLCTERQRTIALAERRTRALGSVRDRTQEISMNAARFALAPLFVLAVACSGTGETPKDQLAASGSALTVRERDQAFLARFDSNKDGKLQVAELPERMRAHLADADNDKDGVLSSGELAAAHQKRQDAHFARLDADGDGKIPLATLPADLPEHVRQRIAAADTDKDGTVTRAEFAALPPPEHDGREHGWHRSDVGAKHFEGGPGGLLKKLDANGDGTVTVAELPADLPAPIRERLAAADSNKDGILSNDELAAAHPKPTFEGFLKRFDVNQDGKVAVTELPTDLPAPFRADLVAADTDKDGLLSKEEMDALHAKHAGERHDHER